MKALVVDLTHGGITIALALKKHFKEVFAWDIYNTLNQKSKKILIKNGIKLVNKIPKSDNLKIIAPIHCPLNLKVDYTHHEIVKFLLSNDEKLARTPIIEVTGVKGKTSVVWMLKEILREKNPLILSSIGAFLSGKKLKENISITPASIIETVELAKGLDYQACIFESSLGGTGLADVGILTNIVEDYPIQGGKEKASKAKAQIFKSKITCCEHTAYKKYYNQFKNVNTFSITENDANIYPKNINYGLEKTRLEVHVKGLKTITGKEYNTRFPIETFAPGPHYLLNLLAAVSGALTLDISIKQIQKGLRKFKGIKGRSSRRRFGEKIIIEEINPGINSEAIKYTLKMAQNLKAPIIILGGDYGIACEEIDEDKTANIIEDSTEKIILTGEMGKNIQKKLHRKIPYIEKRENALKYALSTTNKHIILIYRSEYSKLQER
ncbi:coenzyme F430 synthase [Methanothermobacter tenebrarum]|uniref:Coenzyme F430 synthase n=1 Tax=Methanothermobacter tenebrarum TaxID=680118 RepID=A0A328PDV3_9EURY|nr:coenzyme F430 synthase [Methanothermobacter tenebrarum]MBC7100141.1 coenzyme F430 synthase [Methanobacteriales archaeon]NPV64930.1 coenzyme F430 synthase [Methanobacteriaceae archaeon]RAO79381.1 coenzyme F430 synthase [Methanothermobacter tenebrarum]